MATINSLLFLLTTMAPNMEPPGNYPVNYNPSNWIDDAISSRFPQNAPGLNCGIGETISCNFHCQKNCTNYDRVIPCPRICVLGCVCIEPFIRAPDGSCIMPYECPADVLIPDTFDEINGMACKVNEEASYFQHCETNCSNYDSLVICPGYGAPGCVCKEPLIRGPEGNCIMPKECSQVERVLQATLKEFSGDRCQPDEVFSNYAHCQLTCENYNKRSECPGSDVQGCECKFPLVRGPDGTCIPREQCLEREYATEGTLEEFNGGRCKPDEVVSNYARCQLTCENYKKRSDCNWKGFVGCVCRLPLVRGPDGTCILPEQCPESEFNTEDAAVELAGTHCEADEAMSNFAHCQLTCENYNIDTNCEWSEVQDCMCKYPLVRGPEGSCISQKECPTIDRSLQDTVKEFSGGRCRPDEVLSNYAQSQTTCENYKMGRRWIWSHVQDCVCKFPLIRGPDGACVLPDQCPENEEDSPCEDECDKSNDEDDNTENCLNVIPDPLQKLCDDKNEVYRVCSSRCPDNCENYKDTRRACKILCWPIPKCECKDGYVRGPNGKCIKPEQCLNSDNSDEACSENEEYKACGTACPKNCQNYDMNIPCEFKCQPGCFCKESMVRGSDGKCIHKEECPAKLNQSRQPRRNWNAGFFPDLPKLKCEEPEEFSLCAPLCPITCSNYQESKLCKDICVPGCWCKKGHVKAENGTCISIERCNEDPKPIVCNDDLEVYDTCGSHCETDCYNYNVTDRKCADTSCKVGCFCKSGLVRSPDGKCISPDSCPAPQNNLGEYMESLKRKSRFGRFINPEEENFNLKM